MKLSSSLPCTGYVGTLPSGLGSTLVATTTVLPDPSTFLDNLQGFILPEILTLASSCVAVGIGILILRALKS